MPSHGVAPPSRLAQADAAGAAIDSFAMRPGRNEAIYLELATANGAARFPTSLHVAR